MGKILKMSVAFALSFVMLLTLSGFGRPSAATEVLNDADLQNVCECTVKVENKGAFIARFSVSYQNSDSTWVSVMNQEEFATGRSKEVSIPKEAKNVNIKGDFAYNLTPSWECIFDNTFSNEYYFAYIVLKGTTSIHDQHVYFLLQ